MILSDVRSSVWSSQRLVLTADNFSDNADMNKTFVYDPLIQNFWLLFYLSNPVFWPYCRDLTNREYYTSVRFQ